MRAVKRTFNLQRLKSQICFIYLPESVNFACGNPLFIVSSTLEPTAYPTHDGQYAAAYETYEKEVSPDTLHKSLTLPDSHARNDVRSGNQGSRGSWSESQPFPSLRGLAVRHRLRILTDKPLPLRSHNELLLY